MTDMQRLEVNINPETQYELTQLVARHGVTMTEVVRRAVAVYKFVSDEVAQGRKIQSMTAREKNKRDLILNETR